MANLPGHWLLARLGKRVLRPGGLELTRQMLDALDVQQTDTVIEFAPGLGVTAQRVLQRNPQTYTGVERDEAAARIVRGFLHNPRYSCVVGSAQATGLPDASATVLYGEAMLSMQLPSQKQRIVHEAARLLQPGGRYGIHEMAFVPEDLDVPAKREISEALSHAISHGFRIATVSEWAGLLESEGIDATARATAPMRLLEPTRIIADEGFGGAVRFAWNVLRHADARKRVLAMRAVFRRYGEHLSAVMLVGVKRA